MSSSEVQEILIDQIRQLSNKIDALNTSVSGLSTEIALLKRDKAWSKWLIGTISSLVTLGVSAFISKGG
jgi:prefoldin subunit 5